MTSLRASYPVLKDRFASYTKLPFGFSDYYAEVVSIMQANGYMFAVDEWGLHASSDGASFRSIAELYGDKIKAVAYGNGKYVFVGDGIWTSDGPDEYFNWNLQVQTPASSVFFMDVHFDGTAFVAAAEGMSESGNKPIFNRALASDVTTWAEVEGASLDAWTDGCYIFQVKSHGGRMLAVGGAQGEYALDDWRAIDVIQYSDDNGETWTNVAQTVLAGEESPGLTSLEYVNDRWLALSSEEAEEGIPCRFIQSTDDGESWESIKDRLASPLFEAQQPEPPEKYNLGALFNDNGRIVCFLPCMELQIGRMGADGPTDFERVSFGAGFQESEKGMLLFKGNYYMASEVSTTENMPAYLIAFTPRVPVVG